METLPKLKQCRCPGDTPRPSQNGVTKENTLLQKYKRIWNITQHEVMPTTYNRNKVLTNWLVFLGDRVSLYESANTIYKQQFFTDC